MGVTDSARRRRPTPVPCRNRTSARTVGKDGDSRRATARTSVPAGTSYAPDLPVARTGPTMRDRRNTRSAPRSTSNPTTYQRPDERASPHGWTRRVVGSGSLARW